MLKRQTFFSILIFSKVIIFLQPRLPFMLTVILIIDDVIYFTDSIRDLYELMLQKEALEERLGHQIVRKSSRSPSLRLRFGRRSDPNMLSVSIKRAAFRNPFFVGIYMRYRTQESFAIINFPDTYTYEKIGSKKVFTMHILLYSFNFLEEYKMIPQEISTPTKLYLYHRKV